MATVAEMIVTALADLGVKHVFLLTGGGAIDPERRQLAGVRAGPSVTPDIHHAA